MGLGAEGRAGAVWDVGGVVVSGEIRQWPWVLEDSPAYGLEVKDSSGDDVAWVLTGNPQDGKVLAAAPELLAACVAGLEHMEFSTPQGREARLKMAVAVAKAIHA